MGKPTRPVDLDRHRNVGSLLGTTFSLLWRHAGLFLPMTAIVAVPYVLAKHLVWGEYLRTATIDFTGRTEVQWDAIIIPAIVGNTVIPALITALHVVALRRIAEGERPSLREAVTLAGDRAWPAIGAAALYLLAVLGGLALLALPGYWLAVRLYFGAQLAVVEGLGPRAALRRSAELVEGRWWRTFWRFALALVVFGLIFTPVDLALGRLDHGPVYVLLRAVVSTVSLSLTALFGTLLFFDYHAGATRPPMGSPSGG
jgi:hypothetical protein